MTSLANSPEWKRKMKETELAGRKAQQSKLEFERDHLASTEADITDVDERLAGVASEIAKLEADIRALQAPPPSDGRQHP